MEFNKSKHAKKVSYPTKVCLIGSLSPLDDQHFDKKASAVKLKVSEKFFQEAPAATDDKYDRQKPLL